MILYPLTFIGFIGFLIIFHLIHLILKKPFNQQHYTIIFFLVLSILYEKIKWNLWLSNLDVYWHWIPKNILYGFPAFFVFKEAIDFLSFGLSFYLLPLIFSSMIFYVFLVWLNQKKINLIALILLLVLFSNPFLNLFSFSREPVIVLFALLFFYFLEKFYHNNKKRNLIASTLFLCLACLTKLTGFLLIPFFIWILTQKKSSKLFLLPVAGILFYLLFYTNLSANLGVTINIFIAYGWPLITTSLTVLLIVFPLNFLVLFKPFIKPKNFLWQVSAYFLLLLFLVGIKCGFLWNTDLAGNLTRYFLIFLLPFVLWLSIEVELFYKKLKERIRSQANLIGLV